MRYAILKIAGLALACQASFAQTTMSLEGFETPSFAPSGYGYFPSGSSWKFSGPAGSGIQHNGSSWGAASAPDGTQTAFLHTGGARVWRLVNLPVGTYNISFFAARRPFGSQTPTPITVRINNNPVSSAIAPAGTSFAKYVSNNFQVSTAGDQTVEFVSSVTTSPDAATLLDRIEITQVSGGGRTFFISPSGNDAYPGNSAAQPWLTFSKAWSQLQPGDTLVVRDGIYKQDLSPPPLKSGKEMAPITVRAENDGMAFIDGETVRPTLALRGSAYLVFEGLKIGNGLEGSLSMSSSTGKIATGVAAHHNIVRRVGVFGSKLLKGNVKAVSISGGSHHNLLEDMWVWGKGRYSVELYGEGNGGDLLDAPYNTLRRIVIRHDPHYVAEARSPQAGLAVYGANNNIIENVVTLDGIQRPVDTESDRGNFYLTSHSPNTVNNNKLLGNIGLNGNGVGLNMDADLSNGNVFENNVMWNHTSTGVSLSKEAQNNVYDRITSSSTKQDAGSTAFYQGGKGTVLRNSLLMNARSYGVKQGPDNKSMTATYNYFYGNAANDCESCGTLDATNDMTHRDPMVRYIVRQEVGSPLKGTGSGGVDRGATVLYRYRDGALTTEKLWPWPNEERIRQDFCNVESLKDFARTGADASAWCTSGKSLTKYIWEAAGQPMPAVLYP